MPHSALIVAAAIIYQDGKILITKRLKKSHLGHCWEFPGGKLHNNETLEACVIRECLEEIGVEINPLRKIKKVIHQYSEVSVELHFFICEILKGSPRAIECEAFAWVSPSELENYEFPEADRQLIQELRCEHVL